MDYQTIIVESFIPENPSGHHGPVHIRPIPGQGEFKPELFVECSKELSYGFPVGTKFKIKAKISYRRESGNAFVYSHYKWDYIVLDKS